MNAIIRDIDRAVASLDALLGSADLSAAARTNCRVAREILTRLRLDLDSGSPTGDIGAFRCLSDSPFPGDMDLLDLIASIERRAANRWKDRQPPPADRPQPPQPE